MSNPLLLLHLLPTHHQSLRILHHYEVAAVRDWVVDGFVLALEEGGDAGGETADRRSGGIEKVPSLAVRQCRLANSSKGENE